MNGERRLSLTLGLGLFALVIAMIGWVLFHPEAIVSQHDEQTSASTTHGIVGNDHNTYCAEGSPKGAADFA